MDRREEASGDERERRATERVSSAAAVGRGMGLGLGWGWGPGGRGLYMGRRAEFLGRRPPACLPLGRYGPAIILRAVPCRPVGLGCGPSTACTPVPCQPGPIDLRAGPG